VREADFATTPLKPKEGLNRHPPPPPILIHLPGGYLYISLCGLFSTPFRVTAVLAPQQIPGAIDPRHGK
jgi:hypothetical protein